MAFLAICLADSSAAQLVQIGPNDRHRCANLEHLKANLHIPSSVQLSGHVEDDTGAPFKNSRIELRRYISETRQVGVVNAKSNAIPHSVKRTADELSAKKRVGE